MEPMKEMCENCPFGASKEQRHMRNSLRPGRFNEICQSIWRGYVFACHKTTAHDDEDEYLPTNRDRECAGARQFLQTAITNREKSERRAALGDPGREG